MSAQFTRLLAVDPSSQAVRLVAHVAADSWEEHEVEQVLAALVQDLASSQASVGLAISLDSSFLLVRSPASIDMSIVELETSEALSPLPLHPDPLRLTDAALAWCRSAALPERDFLAMARLPKHAPTLLSMLAGTTAYIAGAEATE